MEDTAVRASGAVWEELYRTDGPRMWRSLLMLTGDTEAASDAMAEAFAQGLARGDAIRNPAAWVWKAAFMIARGELADRKGVSAVTEQYTVGDNPDEIIDLMASLRRLSPTQRAAVVLHHYVGYSVRDIAAMLETSRSAVGVHLFRGRNRLRRELGGDEDA